MVLNLNKVYLTKSYSPFPPTNSANFYRINREGLIVLDWYSTDGELIV